MITYVDTSTLVKLLIEEEGSGSAALIWDTADALASVALITVEARSALASAQRQERLTEAQYERAKMELSALSDELAIVLVTEELILDAAELAEQDALRAYDAIHLAAALSVDANLLTSADAGLCSAAQKRGLHIANPLEAGGGDEFR